MTWLYLDDSCIIVA